MHILEPCIEFRGLKWGMENHRLWSASSRGFKTVWATHPCQKLCGNIENLSYSVNYQTKVFTFPTNAVALFFFNYKEKMNIEIDKSDIFLSISSAVKFKDISIHVQV